MPLFGGNRDRGPRSAAEREAARLERERRRALREGRPPPEAQVDDGTGDAPADEPAPFEWDAPRAAAEERFERRDEEAAEPDGRAVREAAGWDDGPDADLDEAQPAAPDGLEPAGGGDLDPEREPATAWREPGGDGDVHPRAQAWQQRRPAAAEEPAAWGGAPGEARSDEPGAGRGEAAGGWAAGREADAPVAARGDGPASRGEAATREPEWGADGPTGTRGEAANAWAAGREVEAGADETGTARGGAGETAGAAAPARAGAGAERDPDADAANGRAHARTDPQATQPFEPVDAGPAPRRTLSFPRPQTETGEWDAPIGTLRRSRGGGDPAGRPYRAQPGAPGYPQYRKLAVRPRRRWLRRIAAMLALTLAIAAAAFAFLLFQPKHSSGHGRVLVTVPAGATADQIGDMLAKRGVVRSGFLFSLRARLSGDRGRLRSGRYTLKQGMSYAAALSALTTAPKAAPTVNITVPEGPSRREEAPKLRAAGLRGSYLQATRRSSKLDPRDYGAPRGTRSLEGFLYPDTYQLRRSDATARRLVDRQLAAFKENFAKVDMRRARRRNLSRYDVLIIASMIEREALVPRDRRLIAAVIYNRLKQGIPLGIDATLRYALDQWSRPLRVSELNSDSAFNTRKHRGLPPTPIGNPGLPAMRAAADPANVPYLFYVVKPCGNGAHAFSSTDAQFQRDVQRYNRARARRGGKDPSHC